MVPPASFLALRLRTLTARLLPVAVRNLRAREEAPLEGFVLAIVFAERQRGDGLRHFIAQVKGVAGVEIGRPQCLEPLQNIEGIMTRKVNTGADEMQQTIFGEDAIIVVFDARRKLVEGLRAV